MPLKRSSLRQMAHVFKAISLRTRAGPQTHPFHLAPYIAPCKRHALLRVGAEGDALLPSHPRKQGLCSAPHPSVALARVAGLAGRGCGPLSHLFLGDDSLLAESGGQELWAPEGGRKTQGECDKGCDWVEHRKRTKQKSHRETEGLGSRPPGAQVPSGRAPLPL